MMDQAAETPRLSAHGVAEFMTGNFIGRELLLRRFKYDYPGRRVFVPYYQPALVAIRRYHREGNDPGVFNTAVSGLESKAAFAMTRQQRDRLHANLRAINSYQHHFGDRQFEVLTARRFPRLLISGIEVSCNPDLEVLEFDAHLYLLLNLSVNPPDPESVATLCLLLHKTVTQVDGEVEPSHIRFLDLPTGTDTKWSGRGGKRWAQIEAALRQYAGLWEMV